MKKISYILIAVLICAVVGGVGWFSCTYLQKRHSEISAAERKTSSLQEAISLDNLTAVEFIIKNGANLEAPINQDENGKYFTALGWALFSNRPEIARYLIEQGANVKAEVPLGSSMLYWALAHQMNDVALRLIESGAVLSAKDGYNPLQHAAAKGMVQVVEKLSEKGLDQENGDKAVSE